MLTGRFIGQFSFGLLPLMLSGCCTYLTIDSSTQAFRHDSVRRIDKAVITSDDRLVILVEGTTAESSHVGQYTITVSLPANEDGIWVPQQGMTKGWESGFLDRTDAMPITVAPPVVLSAYYSARGNPEHFGEIAGAERTLYLVQHLDPDRQTPLFYVEKGQRPRKINIYPNGREVKTPYRYPFLLLVPLTIAVDVATFPIQIFFLPTLGDKSPPPVPLKNSDAPVK
jgi:hypothetical protein